MAMPKDDLEEFVADRARANPDFPRLIDDALEWRIVDRGDQDTTDA